MTDQAPELLRELAHCIGTYMSEVEYRSRLSFKAAEFIANRGTRPTPAAARPSDAAVADEREAASYLEFERKLPRFAIPHEEAVRETPDIFAAVYKIVDAQLAQSAPGIAELIRGGIARAIAMKAKASLSPTVASERVSERETMSSEDKS